MFIHNDVPTPGLIQSRKRKRDVPEGTRDTPPFDFEGFDRKPILIRPNPDQPFHKPRCFIPISLIGRINLSLAHLDALATHDRFISAHIPILESCYEHGIDGRILIAEEQDEKSLYALERVARRTCAVVKLVPWLSRQHLTKLEAMPTSETASKPCLVSAPGEGEAPWWSSIAVPTSSVELRQPTHSQALHRLQMKHETGETVTTKISRDMTSSRIDSAQEDHQVNVAEPTAAMTPMDHLQELSRQYLDALYVSRTPLAFFTKGPLSRARAAFTGPSGSESHVAVLASFLRGCVLSVTTMDKKFRQGVLTVIKETSCGGANSCQETSKRKRKRKWKAKRDGSGMFVDEASYIEQWWQGDIDAEAHSELDESLELLVSRRARRLRSRETYLQIILALETLALEATASADQLNAPIHQEGAVSENISTERGASKPSKAKQPQQLATVLEALAERLCIWHSLDGQAVTESTGNERVAAANGPVDELRDFCIEVIIPFFQARVPQEASMINTKLGGPQAPTPKIKRTSSVRKPGEPTARRVPTSDTKKTSHRQTLDSTKSISKHIPKLQRAATDTMVEARIKSEPMDDESLDAIARGVRRRVPAASSRIRPKLMAALGFQGRQVDLSAMSQAGEAKARKKAEMDEKLREAVAAIKKPNRSLALEEMAQKTDMSFAKAVSSKTRPTQTNKRKDLNTQAAVVEATPKHKRTIGATPARRPGAMTASASASRSDHEVSLVPMSSAVRPTLHSSGGETTGVAIPVTGHRPRFGRSNTVDETPSRGFAKFIPPMLIHEPGTLNESPTAQRSVRAIDQTPIRPISMKGLCRSDKDEAAQVPTISLTPANVSIYDALGWNDDEEYEALA